MKHWPTLFSKFTGLCLTLVLTLVALSDIQAPVLASSVADVDVAVIEHLRVSVPKDSRDQWLAAERGSWEPWLQQQQGFLGRDVLWDPSTEEGVLMIRWSSREAWKAIPFDEVLTVQDRFEQLARQETGQRQGNPFPLVFEGELLPQ